MQKLPAGNGQRWKILDLKAVVEPGGVCLVVLTLDEGIETREIRRPISYLDTWHPVVGGYYIEGDYYEPPLTT